MISRPNTPKPKPKQKPQPRVRLPRRKMKGKGDYSNADLAAVNDIDRRLRTMETGGSVNALATLAGGALGSLVGQPELGAAASSGLAKWFGYGDYNLRSNSLIEAATATTGATFLKNGRGDRIIHREYIGDIITGAANAFNNVSFSVNPGIAATFPWLSGVAANYEQYEPHGVIFEFISTSGAFNGASQALGTVIMASEYDPSDPIYPTKIEMENSDYSNSARTSANQMHGIECAPNERGDKLLLVRTGGVGTESLKFYDLCNTQVATVGVSGATVNVGELWVSYDFSFYKKQLNQGQVGNTILVCALTSSTGVTTAAYFGTVNSKAGNLPLVFGTATITFPSHIVTGKYHLSYFLSGTTVNGPTITATTNCTMVPVGQFTVPNFANVANTTLGQFESAEAYILITGPSAVITFSAGTLTAITALQLFVSQFPFSTLTAF